MAKSLEEHLADFLVDQAKLGLGTYCQRCIEFWREHYGTEIAEKAAALGRKALTIASTARADGRVKGREGESGGMQ